MGMRMLLDTNVFIWMMTQPDKLSHTARTLMEDPDNERLVSAISAYEISQKTHNKKMDIPGFPVDWESWLERFNVTILPLTDDHGITAGTLEWDNRDPFDRMLVAQAYLEQIPFVTADKRILSLPLLQRINAAG